MIKRIVPMVLCVCLALSGLPMTVKAENADGLAEDVWIAEEAELARSAGMAETTMKAGEAAETTVEETSQKVATPVDATPEDKGDIEWSLSDKGVLTLTVTGNYKTEDIPWKVVKDRVKSVVAKGENLTSMASFFENCTNLTSVDFKALDTSRVTDFSNLFKGCTSLKTINLSVKKDSKWSVEAGKDFSGMFEDCTKLSKLTLDNWKLGKSDAISLKAMFKNCSSIEKISLSTWEDTEKVESFEQTFYDCDSLEEVDFLGFDFSGVSIWKAAFYKDSKLSCKIDVLRLLSKSDIKDALYHAATAADSAIVVRYSYESYLQSAKNLIDTADSSKAHISTFLIRKVDEDNVKLSDTVFYYTGEEIKPAVTVTYKLTQTEEKDGKKVSKTTLVTLKENEDYRLTFSNNTDVTKKALVTIKAVGDYSGCFERKFTIKLKSNTLSVNAKEFKKNRSTSRQTVSFTATALEGDVTVSSNTSKVMATIDEKGNVSVSIAAKYVGEAIIAVKSKGSKYYAACRKNVVITVRPNKVNLSSISTTKKGYISLKWKKVASASGYQIKYADNDQMLKSKTIKITKGATVTKNLTGLKPETTYYVMMRSYREAGGTIIYGAWNAKTSITTAPIAISSTSVKIKKGKTFTLEITGTDKKVVWSTSKKKVATVDSKGKVKAKKKGTATITATVDDKMFICIVKVPKTKKKKKDKNKDKK